MLEKAQKRKLTKDPPDNQDDIDTTSSIPDENRCVSKPDCEGISSKIENRMSKRLRETERSQRGISSLIENLLSNVDNLSNVSSEHGCSTSRIVTNGVLSDN